jgi:death-on-curing protein
MWFSDEEWIVALHERVLDAAPPDVPRIRGILQAGSIRSAVERARWGPFQRGDLAERAALLLRAICEEHPFADGNKRTGFEAAETFLGRNGQILSADEDETLAFVLAVARGELEIAAIAAWIRSRAGKV